MEDLFGYVFKDVMNVELPAHFKRLTYQDAMNTYGCDKPDLRYGLEIHDAAPFASESTFTLFQETLQNKGYIKYIVAPKTEGHDFTRKYITSLEDAAKIYGA